MSSESLETEPSPHAGILSWVPNEKQTDPFDMMGWTPALNNIRALLSVDITKNVKRSPSNYQGHVRPTSSETLEFFGHPPVLLNSDLLEGSPNPVMIHANVTEGARICQGLL